MNRYFYHNGIIPLYQKNGELLDLMERAIEVFNLHDKFLMENNYYEVSMVHCLARHMSDLMRNDYRFHNMYADIEYNKGADGNTRVAKYLNNADGDREDNIRLDLVVTSRKNDDILGFHNLLCAEFKKKTNTNDWESDKRRLQELTRLDSHGDNRSLYGYFIGFFVLIDREKMWIENAYDHIGEIPKDQVTGHIYIPDGRYGDFIL